MQKVTLTEEVQYTLQKLYDRGIVMYILSNSIFTGNSARKLLEDFQILHYFKKLYSSADYGVRKPSSKFYQVAVDGIRLDLPELSTNDILYVGNDYETDVIGAASFGLDVAWYNKEHLLNKNNIPILVMDHFKKILDLI